MSYWDSLVAVTLIVVATLSLACTVISAGLAITDEKPMRWRLIFAACLVTFVLSLSAAVA